MIINKNTISIVFLFIGIFVSYTAGHAQSYDSQKHLPAYDSQKHYPAYDGQKQYPAYDSQKHLPAYDAQKHLPAYDSQKHYPAYDGQKPYPAYDAQKHYQYPTITPVRRSSELASHQGYVVVAPKSRYPDNSKQYPYIQQDWQRSGTHNHVIHHNNGLHKTGQKLVVVNKYGKPILTQDIYQPYHHKKHNKNKSGYKKILRKSGYKLIPYKQQQPMPVLYGISLPRMLYKLFPNYIPVMGVETYKLTVHRYPLFLVKPNNATK